MSLFRSSPKSKRTLIFHIGSESVIGAFVYLEEFEGKIIPEIQHAVSVALPVSVEVTTPVLIGSMNKALQEVGLIMVNEKIGSPDEILCFLESPWYAAQARTVRVMKNVPFLINEKLITDLVRRETDLFDREELSSYRASNNEAVLIEREITQIRLNGYPVAMPYGQKVKEISVSLVYSISPKTIIDQIRTIIGNSFHRKDISFRTFGYAGAHITRDLFISHDHFLFINIGGEMTDIVLVKDNAYVETASFPWGTNTVLRMFSTATGLTLEEARARLSLYATGRLEARLAVKTNKLLDPILAAWNRSLGLALEGLASQFALPQTIALVSESSMLPLFKEVVAQETIVQNLLSTQQFSVVPLSDIEWKDYVRHLAPLHPKTSISALMVAKYMSNNK